MCFLQRGQCRIEDIDKYFPESTWHVFPDGGLITRVQLSKGYKTTKLLEEARVHEVILVAGESFFTKGNDKDVAVYG